MNPQLADMINFSTVVDEKSFTSAAVKLHRTKSALSQSIAKLEEAFDCKLLNRTTRSISPTEAGSMLYRYCKDIEESYDSARLDLCRLNENPIGTLTVSAPQILCDGIVLPTIAEYTKRFPNMSVKLLTGNPTPNQIDQQIDCSVLIDRPVQNTLVISKLGDYSEGIFATPTYIESCGGIPDNIDELNNWYHISESWQGSPLRYTLDKQKISVMPKVQCDSFNEVKSLTLQHAGASLLPYLSILDSYASKQISLVKHVGKRQVYMAHRYPRRTPLKVANFRELLIENFKNRKQFCGEIFNPSPIV